MNNNFDKEELARQILRTSTWDMKKITLPSKSGYKFVHKLKEDEEDARLGSYFDSHFEHHAMMKTNKLANMGLAEWLPELKVAKIVKEAKFMQRMGRPHREKFLFLFAEEALYLLDTGCIELNLSGVPLAMDRARELLLCQHRADNQELLVTPDEYKLYAWLTRLGFVLQRHKIPNIIRKAKPYSVSDCTGSGGASCSKKPKIETDAKKNETDAVSEGAIMHDNPEKENTEFYTLSTFQAVLEEYSNVVMPAIPDFDSISLTLDSKDFPSNSGVTSIAFDLKDNQPFDIVCPGAKVKEEFLCKYREMIDAASSCSDWKTYKESMRATRNFRNILENDKQTLIDKHTLLANPKQVLDRLKIFKTGCSSSSNVRSKLKFIYNVYEKNSSKAFRKSNPGQPFCKLLISRPDNNILSFDEIQQLNEDGVSVKLAVLDEGCVTFSSLDVVNVPDAIDL